MTENISADYSRKRLWLTLGMIGVALLAGFVFFVRSPAMADRDNDQELLSQALGVSVMPLRAVDHYQVKQKYSGTITAGRESDHGFDRGGLLANVLVDEGDHVKKGDVLARLDRRRLDSRERELDADLARAIALNNETAARLDRAQATYNRYEVLVGRKNISEQAYDKAKFDLIALKAHKIATEAAITRAKAALKSLKTDQDMTNLIARFDGSVVKRYRDEGAALTLGTPVIRLIEDQKLEIHVGLPLSALPSFTAGKTYIFNYQGGKITTKLRTILKQINQATRTVTAIFDVEDHNDIIRAGALAELTVAHDIKQSGFWVPIGALAESRRGLWSVYTLEPYKGAADYSTLSRQELQILYTDSDRAFVRGTLQDGDRIVSGGIHRLVPGQLVLAEDID